MTTATNDPRTRIFVNNTWVDVTDRMRQHPEIVITTGRQDESDYANPGSCTLTFDNDDGAFTPRNPMSPYYGYLNRNTPICVMLDEIRDRYGRVVASGWSTTDTGETYATKSVGGTISGTDYSVNGTKGVHSVPAASAYRMSYLGSASGAPTTYNGEILVGPLTLSFTDVTGGALEPGNAVLRLQDDTHYYLVRVTIETDESVKIALLKDGSTTLAAAVTVAGLTHSSSQGLWVRGGAFDSTIYGKVWADGTTEPDDWQIQATDTSYGYGYFGVRTGVAAGNTNTKPIVVSYDTLTLYPSQFNGEIPDWPQEYSDDGQDRVVPIQAAGVLRRLEQGKAPLASTLRRYYESFAVPAPDYYWPLDGGDLSTAGLPSIGNTAFPFELNFALGELIDVDTSKELHFGQAKLGSWLGPGVNVLPTEIFQALPEDLAVPSERWVIDWVRTGGSGTADSFVVSGLFDPGVTILGIAGDIFSVSLDATAKTITVAPGLDETAVVIDATTRSHNVFDGSAHHFRLRANVTNVDDLFWELTIDEVVEGSGTVADHPFVASINAVYLAVNAGATKPTGIGSVAAFVTGDPYSDIGIAFSRFKGITQEAADTRFARLCAEEGVPRFVTGGLGDAMGPQFPDTLTEQFKEIAATDGGIMRELLSARALHYDPRTTLLSRTTTLTLDVGNGELAPPFKPVDDDQILRNRITASKRNAGTYTYELTTGRLGTADPKDGGVGVKDDRVNANPYSENQLVYIAQRAVAAGTVDESRFPMVRVNLMAPTVTSNLRRQVLNTYVSQRIALTNMQDSNVYSDADLLVIGLTKILTPYRHEIAFNCVPFAPYRVFTLDTDRLDTETSTLTANLAASGAATFQVSESSGSLWTTVAGDFPMDINVGGERITISGISGASSPQTFTVSARSVNGVVKSHLAGVSVSLADPAYLG